MRKKIIYWMMIVLFAFLVNTQVFASPKTYVGSTNIKKLEVNGTNVKKGFYNTQLVFSSDHIVTFHLDTNNIYAKELEDGAEIFDYLPNVPPFDGYTFIGWAEKTDAKENVLTNRTNDDDNIHLYAIFKKTVTLTYDKNGATGGQMDNDKGFVYYSCGNVYNCTFKLKECTYDNGDAKCIGYSINNKEYQIGSEIAVSEDTVATVLWDTQTYTKDTTITAVRDGQYGIELAGAAGKGGSGGKIRATLDVKQGQEIRIETGVKNTSGEGKKTNVYIDDELVFSAGAGAGIYDYSFGYGLGYPSPINQTTTFDIPEDMYVDEIKCTLRTWVHNASNAWQDEMTGNGWMTVKVNGQTLLNRAQKPYGKSRGADLDGVGGGATCDNTNWFFPVNYQGPMKLTCYQEGYNGFWWRPEYTNGQGAVPRAYAGCYAGFTMKYKEGKDPTKNFVTEDLEKFNCSINLNAEKQNTGNGFVTIKLPKI